MIALHPFGDPQTVRVSAGDGTIDVHWEVGAPDDLTLLGIHLGVLPDDRVMLDGAIAYDDGDAAVVGESDELATYLLDHITVATSETCAGEVTAVDDSGSADLAFTCPADADAATVTVTTLTDLHPAYRTLATGPDGQLAVYRKDAASHDWALDIGAATSATSGGSDAAASDLGESAAVQMGAVGAVLLILAAGAIALRRWNQRRHHPTPTP